MSRTLKQGAFDPTSLIYCLHAKVAFFLLVPALFLALLQEELGVYKNPSLAQPKPGLLSLPVHDLHCNKYKNVLSGTRRNLHIPLTLLFTHQGTMLSQKTPKSFHIFFLPFMELPQKVSTKPFHPSILCTD